ncbi:MAG TPA: hypothetical protein VLK85_30020 [Ramlibacter sp.]|nr:hypothetical protein [Ramlibacter sp.]
MTKRVQRAAAKPPRARPDPKPMWPSERHSGEGSASALEALQKLERQRRLPRPRDPDDEAPDRH